MRRVRQWKLLNMWKREARLLDRMGFPEYADQSRAYIERLRETQRRSGWKAKGCKPTPKRPWPPWGEGKAG